ncbi:uncharacterized protein N7459_007913 [Penicillium hispanicum]|uniref:uncharacterized protein n=1 Tax=Penicillium hispanicum TaxID=1080232 RepID=UPI00254151E9|nr:uncharacterized protein N7459_007913 [Penicillium hispanicum]KAJ5573486.1 hypothetical protein N7459_007913 [Penicillium hispanicum]
MGFISSMTRRMRVTKLSRRLSTTQPDRRSSDGNDLIKIPSTSASLVRADSHASSTTVVRENHEPVLPTESPTRHTRLTPADLNLQTLFDNADALDASTSRAVRALSMPEYPILKLEAVSSPFDTPPRRTLQAPLETDETVCEDARASERLRGLLDEPAREKDGVRVKGVHVDVQQRPESRLKRSMTGLFKRRSMKILRSSLSLKGLRVPTPPKERDEARMAEEKWLEANGFARFGGNVQFWGVGRPW